MQLSAFEMVKKGVSTIIEVVDAFARERISELDTFTREQINQLNTNLNTKQNIIDNNLVTTSKEIVGAINELNSNLSEIKLKISTKTQTYPITSSSQSAGYYYQNLSAPSEIASINKIYGCMLVDHSGIGTVVSVSVDNVNSNIQARYTQAPNNGSITLKFLYDAN